MGDFRACSRAAWLRGRGGGVTWISPEAGNECGRAARAEKRPTFPNQARSTFPPECLDLADDSLGPLGPADEMEVCRRPVVGNEGRGGEVEGGEAETGG